jgi:hypothetical protein
MNIKTHYWPTPIPLRQFDWSAVDDDTYDYDQPIGYGATEQEAIDDLMDQLEDQTDDGALEPFPGHSHFGG